MINPIISGLFLQLLFCFVLKINWKILINLLFIDGEYYENHKKMDNLKQIVKSFKIIQYNELLTIKLCSLFSNEGGIVLPFLQYQ